MSKHTPGPWRTLDNLKATADGFRAQAEKLDGMARTLRDAVRSIHIDMHWRLDAVQLERELDAARAQLAEAEVMKADLLAACEAVALRHEDDGPCWCAVRIPAGHAHHLSCQRARAAIKKARGER